MDKSKVEISIIIPTFNEESYIKYPFEGLKKQTFKNFEVIIVDKDSRDKTREIAKRNNAKIIIERRPGMALARNIGAKNAKGDIILFIDADTRPSSDLLAKYREAFKDKNVVSATGPLIPLEDTTLFLKFCYRFESVYLKKLFFALGKPAISSSNFAVRRKAFEEVSGFDQGLATYEGHDLSQRLARVGRVIYINDAKVETSVRRVAKWGVLRFILYRTINSARYYLFQKPEGEYAAVR